MAADTPRYGRHSLNEDSADPIEDYLAALRLLGDAADDVDVLVPGHGSIGVADTTNTS